MKILVLGDSGIGGTQKAATLYASGLSKRGHEVIYSTGEGPRAALLRDSGVIVCPSADSVDEVTSLISEFQPQVIHQHVPGYWMENPVYEALEKLPFPKPKLVQTNVFGWLSDPRALAAVDLHLFISKASGAQAFRRAGMQLTEEWLQKCSVVMYPVPPSTPPDPATVQKIRTELGIGPETVLAIRVGQPGVSKWTNWEARALRVAADRGADVQLLLMQPPDSLLPELREGRHAGRIRILPATSDFDFLNNLYHAADVMLHASSYGESFGYTIAEGMAAGLPVICRSTPWGDSAQVELVENGQTGWVCATPGEMGRRLADFANDRPRIQAMGQEGRGRILRLCDLHREMDLLQEALLHLLTGQANPLTRERNAKFHQFSRELSSREVSFSEKRLPLAEKMEWLSYRCYRQLRGKLGKLIK